jgi:ketosteroid isomerase-like protein
VGKMSDDTVRLTQGLYAAFRRGEIDTIIKTLSPDVVWHVEGRRKDHPLLGSHRGSNGVAGFFKTLSETQSAEEFSPREFIVAQDRVFVLGRYRWTMKKSGKRVDSAFIHIFTVRSGKVIAFNEFTDTAQFAEAYKA